MPPPKCPREEKLLEFLSIPNELGLWERASINWHRWLCPPCEKKLERMELTIKAYFEPEPDITSSLVRVYSRLQSDETLIFKGWKLGELTSHREKWLNSGWIFRGAVSFAVVVMLVALLVSQVSPPNEPLVTGRPVTPLARLRFEDHNRVTVHYVQPELLHTVEFQTHR